MSGLEEEPPAVPEIIIVSRRAKKIKDAYVRVDVTSRSPSAKWIKFSPFYPHGDIRIPGTDMTSCTVEGAWQALKDIPPKGTDASKLGNATMKSLKRRGKPLAHVVCDERLGYVEARKKLYVPMYAQQLERLEPLVEELRAYPKLALVDYSTNEDINDATKPLSHAALIKRAILGLPLA